MREIIPCPNLWELEQFWSRNFHQYSVKSRGWWSNSKGGRYEIRLLETNSPITIKKAQSRCIWILARPLLLSSFQVKGYPENPKLIKPTSSTKSLNKYELEEGKDLPLFFLLQKEPVEVYNTDPRAINNLLHSDQTVKKGILFQLIWEEGGL